MQRGGVLMGLVFPASETTHQAFGHALVGIDQAIEVTMLSEGVTVRVGPRDDDICPIEELGVGDAIWDIASQRLVDLDTMSCATLDGPRLAEQGLRPVAQPGGKGWLALASARLAASASAAVTKASPDPGPLVFFRLWPEARLVAEIDGRPVVIRP